MINLHTHNSRNKPPPHVVVAMWRLDYTTDVIVASAWVLIPGLETVKLGSSGSAERYLRL